MFKLFWAEPMQVENYDLILSVAEDKDFPTADEAKEWAKQQGFPEPHFVYRGDEKATKFQVIYAALGEHMGKPIVRIQEASIWGHSLDDVKERTERILGGDRTVKPVIWNNSTNRIEFEW